MHTLRILFLFITILILSACGGGSGDIPPSANSAAVPGSLEGQVSMGTAVRNATINIYSFDQGRRGDMLSSTTSDESGYFITQLHSTSRPILIESIGGEYRELATNNNITINSNQKLHAIIQYDEGAPLTTTISPLTHLHKALVEYKLAQNEEINSAINTSRESIDSLFEIESHDALPHAINEQDNTLSNEEYLYGFSLAGISATAKSISDENGDTEYTTYTSISLLQVIHNDLSSDGLLDGLGYDINQSNLIDLALGVSTMDETLYRIRLPQNMLSMAAHPANQTNLSVSDLLEFALNFSQRSSDILALAGDASGELTTYNITPENLFFNGTLQFAIAISHPHLVSSIRYDVDGTNVGNADIGNAPILPIDTLGYDDGEHQIGVTIIDVLDNELYNQYSVSFDNTSPFINIESPTLTNQDTLEISGSFSDNGSGIRKLLLGESELTLESDTWRTTVDLPTSGANNFVLTLEDWAGNEHLFETTIIRDIEAPSFDFAERSSFANLTNPDGSFTNERLAQINTRPIYIDTQLTGLNGTPILKPDLDTQNLAYFAFAVDDAIFEDTAPYDNPLTVSVRYENSSGFQQSESRVIPPTDNEYLIPLASETLHPQWLLTTPEDTHFLRVTAQDGAGNSSEQTIEFQINFIVEGIDVIPTDVFADLITATPFTDRATLHNTTLDTMHYDFTNPSNHDIWISLTANGTHSVEQAVDHMIREHKARLQTSTEWFVGSIANTITFCDTDSTIPDITRVNNVSAIYDFDGEDFVLRNLPGPVLGDIIDLTSDTATSPDPSGWIETPRVDDFYEFQEIPISGVLITYRYDYLLEDTLSGQLQPASILNWRLDDGGVITTCPDINNFIERNTYEYISEAGYPRNTPSTETIPAEIDSVDYSVFNETLSVEISEISGWYQIPAGHEISIRKSITTPDFITYNDIDVADPVSFSSYTQRSYDQSLSWTFDNALNITATHYSGDDNIHLMTPTDFIAGEEDNYTLSR